MSLIVGSHEGEWVAVWKGAFSLEELSEAEFFQERDQVVRCVVTRRSRKLRKDTRLISVIALCPH